MEVANWVRSAALAGIAAIASPSSVQAATIQINGTLGFVITDQGGGVYSGSPVGTPFSGFIDDTSFGGQISDGTTSISFGCCIAAGGLQVFNDHAIDSPTALLLNFLTGTSAFQAGQIYDTVDIEGDVATAGGGRIEIGVSYLLDAGAFADSSSSNYPFDPADLRLAAFFIFEEDGTSQAIYESVGLLPVPEPAMALAGCAAVLAFVPARRARRTQA